METSITVIAAALAFVGSRFARTRCSAAWLCGLPLRGRIFRFRASRQASGAGFKSDANVASNGYDT